MDANLDKIAKDLYGKIQTRFPNIKIGDENAGVLSKKEDIPKARFFEFEYVENGEPLGTIAITLDEEEGIVVQVSGDLVDDDKSTTHHGAYKFIRSFRQFAKDRLLNFDVQNIGKSNLDKRDYQFQAKRKEMPTMPAIMENKLYGNARMSYQDLGEARLIIKHSQAVNPELPAGRTMHIESIYIENAEGERFKYPYKHLNGARALAEHVKHGGTPYDAIGKYVVSLSEELASLRKFKGYVSRQAQLSEAMGVVTGKVSERIEDIKKEIGNLQKTSYYSQFAESFEEREEEQIPEDMVNSLVDRLTIRTFNEELKSVFPYIYKFVSEDDLPVSEVGVDDILDEKAPEGWEGTVKAMKKHKEIDNPYALANWMKNKGMKSHKKESLDPEAEYESFMDSIIAEDNDLFSPNKDAQQSAIEKLNDIMSKELKGGPEGVNAINSIKGIIDDPEFLEQLRDIDPDLDVRPLIQKYVQETAPDIAVQLHFGGEEAASAETEAPPAAPEAPPAAPEAPAAGLPENPPPPAPVAESAGELSPFSKIKDKIIKARECGATLDTKLDFGSKEMTLHDAIKECGMTPMECGFEDPDMSATDKMLKFVSGFYNRESGNFPLGGERIKIKVKKAFEDGMFGECSPSEVVKVFKFIDSKDQPKHGHDDLHDVLRLGGVVRHNDGKHPADVANETGPDFDNLMGSFNDHLEESTVEVNVSEFDRMKQLMKQLVR